MPVEHHYGLYPWSWDAELQTHRPPAGARAVLDLRSLPQQATLGQSDGWGFFDWMNGTPRPADAIALGDGDCREIQPTTATRQELQTRLGLSAQPSGATLIDCIADVFGDLSDPTGESGPKPLMPIQGDGLEILLAGHSKVWGAPYAADEVLSVGAKGRANRQRDVWRSTMKQALDVSPEHAAKVLGAILRQHGVSMDEIDQGAPGRKAQWQILMTARDRQRAGGSFKPKRPRTSFTESFNGADSATFGVDLTWYEYTPGNTETKNNRGATLSNSGFSECRAEHDVSSADHYVQVSIVSCSDSGGDNHQLGPACRFSPSAKTHYMYRWIYNTSSIMKVVAGAYTDLVNVGAIPDSRPVTFKVDASGSTIKGFQGASQKASVTDTSITGNTRGGLYLYDAASANIEVDDWTIDDGISAGGQPMALRRGTRQGFARIGRQV